MGDNQALCEMFEKRRAAYSEDFKIISKFQNWYKLLTTSIDNIDDLTRGYRSVRRRSQQNFRSIARDCGPEVMVLCIIATTPAKLAKVKLKSLISDLQTWWKNATHPPALTIDACRIYKKFPLSNYVAEPKGLGDKVIIDDGAISAPNVASNGPETVPTTTEVATTNFENAMYNAAAHIPLPQRNAWLSQCSLSLQSLRELTEFSTNGTCFIAHWNKLKALIGDYLFQGMENSWHRSIEEQAENMKSRDLTSAVNLKLAGELGGDFYLTIYLCEDVGSNFHESSDLQVNQAEFFGEVLFAGMNDSKEKGSGAHTFVVEVVEGGDYKVTFALGFTVGRIVWRQCF